MNKVKLVKTVADAADVPKSVANRVIREFMETVSAELAKGDRVVLTGFGTFSVKQRSARIGRNPQTGAKIQIAAAKIPSFKAGKRLRDTVNG